MIPPHEDDETTVKIQPQTDNAKLAHKVIDKVAQQTKAQTQTVLGGLSIFQKVSLVAVVVALCVVFLRAKMPAIGKSRVAGRHGAYEKRSFA